MSVMEGLSSDRLFCVLFVCFFYRVCGFVMGISEVDRVRQLINMLYVDSRGSYDCNCVMVRRFWAGIIYCKFISVD